MTGKTTIELTDEQKEMLLNERLSHESNYGQTIERLCGESQTGYVTETEVRDIVTDMVVLEALE